MEGATYKIRQEPEHERHCICTHSQAAHGSNGRICCACRCTQFIEAHDSKRPAESRV